MKSVLKVIKNKTFIIISCIIFLIVIIFLAFYLIVSNSLKLNGESKINISYNEEYKENGATFKVFGNNLTKNIKVSSTVKNGKVGSYKVIYKAKYLFFTVKKIRIVNVVDEIAPIITLSGENKINICPGKDYEEKGYEAIDEYDGDLTDKVTLTSDENQIIYEVSDSSGNKEKVIREIIKEDIDAPILKLKGSSTLYIRNGAKYKEYGYEVSDNCDEEIAVDIKENINTSLDGNYNVTYEAKDSSGNVTTIERKVVVYTDNRIGIVYLTFDDGPSGTGSTEKILNVLKEEGVKATFFVTGNGPDNLIKREYDEGHTVALHTNTHNYYTLYASVDAYYNDLNAVKNRVYNITGQNVNIIRFPGGSNNTVSITASGYKIMDTLTGDVMDKGYIYYDWNISSGDAGGCTTSSCVYNNVVNGLSKNRVNMILMHDIKMFTANALKDIIEYCKDNGYVFDVITESTPQIKFK